MSLRVEVAGHAFVTDLGRPGRASVGVAAGGAADRHAATLASTLVGNRPGDPLVEVTGSAFALVADAPLLLAASGAVDEVRLDGEPNPAHELLVVGPGVRCEVPAPTRGWRTYVAVNGRIDVPTLLGSVAPDPLLGVGTRLSAGARVALASRFSGLDHPDLRLPLFRLGAPATLTPGPAVIDVTEGPEAGELSGGLDGTFTVDPSSDAVGLRLAGPAPVRRGSREILSRGVPVGAVEVPPGGGLLALLRNRLVTAGYPVVAVATTAGVDRLAQLRPGEEVRFRSVGLGEALAQARARETVRLRLATRVGTALTALGLGDCLAATVSPPRRLVAGEGPASGGA